jgi:hypothetical protein
MVQITFVSMRLESNCNHDYLLIRNGPYSFSPLINKYCGNSVPLPVLSESNALWIEFHSDDSSEDQGFEMTLESVFEGELAAVYLQVLCVYCDTHLMWVGLLSLVC